MTVKYVKAMPKLTDVKTIAHSSFWGSSSTLRFRNFRPILFLFCKEACEKKPMAYVSLQLNLPPPLIQAGALLAGPPLPSSERTYFMDEPLDFLYYKIQ